MKFSMCNEFCEGWPLARVFDLAQTCGYEGVEIAPFTLGKTVDRISAAERSYIRRSAEARGLKISALHWLLSYPSGLHTNSPDSATRTRTRHYFMQLIRFCADLGAARMVIGSPKQRSITPGEDPDVTWQRTVEFYKHVAAVARECGVWLGFEPLGRWDTDFINSVGEGICLVQSVNHPHFRLTLDARAMSGEGRPLPEIIREAAPYLVHFHANDPNRREPGSGSLDFVPVLAALNEVKYDGWVSIEVFDFTPGPETIAREGIEYLRRCLERS